MKKANQKKRPFKFSPIMQLLAATGLFAVSVLITKTKGVADWEIWLFEATYGLSDFFKPFFFTITQLGSIIFFGLLLLLFLFKKRYDIMTRLLMSGTLAYLISGFAKDIWGRDRPTDFLDNVVNLDYVVRGPGFPSGHTALATALALTVAHYTPKRYRWLIIVWIIGVGISRMYLGIHFPMDIVGGFAIGWASYAVFQNVRLYSLRPNKTKKPKKF